MYFHCQVLHSFITNDDTYVLRNVCRDFEFPFTLSHSLHYNLHQISINWMETQLVTRWVGY